MANAGGRSRGPADGRGDRDAGAAGRGRRGRAADPGETQGEGPSAAALLIGLPGAITAEWLEPAIEHARPEELPALTTAAVPAGPRGVAAIILRLDDVDPGRDLDAVTVALRASSGLPEALARAMGAGELRPTAIARLAGVLGGVPGAAAAGPLAVLAGGADAGGEAASVALRRWMDAGGDRRITPEALESAMHAWAATRRPDLLVAIAMAIGRMRGGVELLDAAASREEGDPALRLALGSILQRSSRGELGATIAPRILGWLAVDPLERSVQRALGDTRSREEAMAIFAGGHVLDLPGTRRGLAGVSRPARGLPPASQIDEFTPRAARGLARYVARVPLTPAIRARTLIGLSGHADPLTAWRATQRLAGDSIRRVGEPLARLAVSGPPVAARVAMRRLRTAGGGPALDRRLADGGGAGDGDAARPSVSRAACRRTPEHPGRRAAGRTAAWRRAVALDELGTDRDRVLGEWRAALVGGDSTRRRAVIAAAARLGMVRQLSDAIGACALSEDVRVASAACSALRWARDDASGERLRRAARGHGDPRVRANALESLARRGDADLETITRAAASPRGRERSVAAIALRRIDPVRAGRLAGALLMDARPEHRVSGVWTARRLREPLLVPILVEVVRRDPEPEVRHRARAALSTMVSGERIAASPPVETAGSVVARPSAESPS